MNIKIRQFLQISIGLVLVFGLLLQTADASILTPAHDRSSNAPDSYGDFTGSMTYSASNSMNSMLVIELTNTTAASVGGFLTAFVLNNPSQYNGLVMIDGISLMDPPTDFELIGSEAMDTVIDDDVSAAPFHWFDFGVSATGGTFGGGGAPAGIAIDATATFKFIFTGTGLDLLTTDDFFDEKSTMTPGVQDYDSKSEFLVTRFKGFNSGIDPDSDKLPADMDGDPGNLPGPGPVPEPTAALIWCSNALLVLVISGRRRRRS